MRRFFPFLFLIVVCLLLLLPGLMVIPSLDRDESRFVQASKQMLETHNFQQIKFQDTPRHLKPPGIYWMQAIATKYFAHSYDQVWSYRLPSLLGGLSAVLLLYAFFASRLGREAAFLSAGVLASSLLFVLESHIGTTDAALLGCMVLMQGGLWKSYESFKLSAKTPWYWAMLFWLGMTCGVFIKGTSPFIGLLTLVGICILERSVSFLKQLRFGYGLLLLLALSMAWLIPISLSGHSNFLWDMLRKDALPKVFGNAQGHGALPGYFLVLLPMMFWPCSVLIFRGIVSAWKQREAVLQRFLFAWILPCWIFIALVHTKLPEYALPIYPALALLVGLLVKDAVPLSQRMQRVESVYRIIWLCLTIVIAVAFPIISYLLLKHLTIVSVALTVMTLGFGIGIYRFSCQQAFRNCMLLSLVAGVFIYGFLCQFYLSSLQPMWLTQQIKRVISQNHITLTAQTPLYVSHLDEPSMVFYLGTDHVKFVSYDTVFELMAASKAKYALMQSKYMMALGQYSTMHHFQVQQIATINGFNYEHGRFLEMVLIERKS